ncbi:DUF382 domain-containing protein [Acetobacter pasteurianus]|nr:DUF382 domain-containing protein [Acetobacter pasteurianus]
MAKRSKNQIRRERLKQRKLNDQSKVDLKQNVAEHPEQQKDKMEVEVKEKEREKKNDEDEGKRTDEEKDKKNEDKKTDEDEDEDKDEDKKNEKENVDEDIQQKGNEAETQQPVLNTEEVAEQINGKKGEHIIKVEESSLLQEYEFIFNKFNIPNAETATGNTNSDTITVFENVDQNDSTVGSPITSDDELDNDEIEGFGNNNEDIFNEQPQHISRRQQRLRNKVPISSLKILTHRPDLVEAHDADSHEPNLLVHLKSLPNAIPVPSHWSSKRDYLSSKRGIERPPFQLPKFIRDTGIQEMRETAPAEGSGENANKTLKQQQRERVQVKLGRLDIDYEKLYNAFFHHQTKPRTSQFGELYEEGKEMIDEMTNQVKNYRPGVISLELRRALGMNEHDLNVAPAWITIMKDIGKPPSYEDLIIPGIDIRYDNLGYRDKHGGDFGGNVKYWGRIRNNIDEEEGDEDDDDEEEEDEDAEEDDENDDEEEEEEEDEEVVDVNGGETKQIFNGERGKDDKVRKVANDYESKIKADSASQKSNMLTEDKEKQSLTDILSDVGDAEDKKKKTDAQEFLYKVLTEKKADGMTSHTYDL